MKLDVKHMDFYWEDWGRFGTLAGLDQATVLDIMDDYYNSKKKVVDIWAEYGLSGNNRLSREFPPQLLSEKCPYDGHRLIRFMPARNQDPEDYVKKCPKCGHEPYYGDECECAGCRQKRQAMLDDKQQRIREYYLALRPKRKVKFDQLSPVDQLYLAAMYFLPGGEDDLLVEGDTFWFLTPSENWTGQIVKDFVERQILVVDPDSPAEAFSSYPPYQFDLLSVNYRINVNLGSKGTSLFEKMDWTGLKKDKEACLDIWRKLNYWECLNSVPYIANGDENVDFGFYVTVNVLLKRLVEERSLKEAKAVVVQAAKLAKLRKSQGLDELDDFLEELADLVDGKTALDPDAVAAVRSKATVLQIVFSQEVLAPKVDFFEVVPSTDLIAD